MPTYPIPATSTWYSNVLITAALIQANITDYLTDLHNGADGHIGEASSGSTVTLSTASAFAGLATVSFTLAEQRRVRIHCDSRYQLASATLGRMTVQAGYNTGGSAAIGSFTGVGIAQSAAPNASGAAGSDSTSAEGTVLLAAGTYTAYAAVTRANGGSTTDVAASFYTVVTDVGAV